MTALWYVYVLTSSRKNRTYVGVALDVDKRLSQHNGELRGGAKSTRAGRPWTVGTLYGPYTNRAEAQRIERRVKSLPSSERLTLLAHSSSSPSSTKPS